MCWMSLFAHVFIFHGKTMNMKTYKLAVPWVINAINGITYRSYKKFDDENFKHDVENALYHVGEIFDDFDDKFWFQKKLMEGVINGHAPIKRRKAPKKKTVPFMNAPLRKACHYKAMRRNKYFRHGRTKSLWELYRKSRNEASKLKVNLWKYISRKSVTNKNLLVTQETSGKP